jgi:hypothetical protein
MQVKPPSETIHLCSGKHWREHKEQIGTLNNVVRTSAQRHKLK